MVRASILAALVLTVAAAAPASAHHGTGQYDFTREIPLTGRVKAYEFGNPHIWLTLEVAGPGGRMQDWSLEGPPPAYAAPRGWAPDSLMAGQTVQVAMSPLRDGSMGGIIITVRDAGGKVLLERGRRY